jgi:sialic acid synthase SpsE/sugar phosphate isomerase/epimerase
MRKKLMNIGQFEVGSNRAFVIAEIGNNHNGDFDRAIQLIDLAKDAGADCVKFQIRDLDSLYRQKALSNSDGDLGTEYVLDLLRRYELTASQHKLLYEYCRNINLLYMCTPWDHKSVDILESFSVRAYKVASADLTNLPLLEKLAKTKKPLILSTGMSTEEEILITTGFLNKMNVEFVLLHCNSTYPAPFQDINLRWLSRLKEIHPFIGYSGHERGTSISIAAVALGASVIERHFTLDRLMEGPDHAASLEPSEFKFLVDGIRQVEAALGDPHKKLVSQGEMINRENLAKSLVASRPLKSGSIIVREDISVMGPGQGLSPQKINSLIGKVLLRDMNNEDFFFESDLFEQNIQPDFYAFKRPWGIPVRYHDFDKFNKIIEPNLFEFHLSYSDMNLSIDKFLNGTYPHDFVVHAPELFENSCLLDLASLNEEYRRYSVDQMNRVIELTLNLKKYFPRTERPMIVTNIGGFSMDAPLSSKEVNQCYQNFKTSLNEIDFSGVELLPQTMAPFPWHFGGQRFQNLFVVDHEIEKWCNELNLRMCLDVSHTRLTCNHLGLDFYKFIERIAPFSAHLHLGDASGVNGEGLQIGDGDIDFSRLLGILDRLAPKASFIPEIWQGHKNGGSGFWTALGALQKIGY